MSESLARMIACNGSDRRYTQEYTPTDVIRLPDYDAQGAEMIKAHHDMLTDQVREVLARLILHI